MNYFAMAFGIRIKELRTKRKVSVQKMADAIGVDAERWRKWEEKDLNPRDEDAGKIEDFFGMTISEVEKLKNLDNFQFVPKKESPDSNELKLALAIIKQQNEFLQKSLETKIDSLVANSGQLSKGLNDLYNKQVQAIAETRGYAQYQINQQVDWDQKRFLEVMGKVGKLIGANLKADDQLGKSNG